MSEKRKINVTTKEEEAMPNINVFALKSIIFAYSLVTLIEEFATLYIENRSEFGKLKENSPLGFWCLIIIIAFTKVIKKFCFEFFFCSMVLYFLFIANNNKYIMNFLRFFLNKLK